MTESKSLARLEMFSDGVFAIAITLFAAVGIPLPARSQPTAVVGVRAVARKRWHSPTTAKL